MFTILKNYMFYPFQSKRENEIITSRIHSKAVCNYMRGLQIIQSSMHYFSYEIL